MAKEIGDGGWWRHEFCHLIEAVAAANAADDEEEEEAPDAQSEEKEDQAHLSPLFSHRKYPAKSRKQEKKGKKGRERGSGDVFLKTKVKEERITYTQKILDGRDFHVRRLYLRKHNYLHYRMRS